MNRLLKRYVKSSIKRPWTIGRKRACNICGFHYKSFVEFAGREAVCPACLSLERQRHFFLLLQQVRDSLKGKKILHFAPEECIAEFFKASGCAEYIEADIERSINKIDITDIPYPDGYFDVAVAFHVLEHIVDDDKAFRELHRVAKERSITYLCVPMKAGVTFEDKTATTPEQRKKLYGLAEHVRIYGKDDFKPRFESYGYEVTASDIRDFPPDLVNRHKLGDIIYVGKKLEVIS